MSPRRDIGGDGFSPAGEPINGVTGTGTDNRIARWDGTGAIQDSEVTILDTGYINMRGRIIYGCAEFAWYTERDEGSVASGTVDLRFDLSQILRIVVTGNATLRLRSPYNSQPCWVQAKVSVTAGPPVVSWSTESGSLTWTPGAAPVFAANTTRLCRFYFDGSNWFGEFTAGF